MIADEDDKFHDEEIIYFGPSPSNQINEQTDEPNQFMDDLLQSIDNLEAMKRTYMYLMDFHTVYISNTVYGLSNKAEWTRNVEDCVANSRRIIHDAQKKPWFNEEMRWKTKILLEQLEELRVGMMKSIEMHMPKNDLVYESFVDPNCELINLSQALVSIADNDVKKTHGSWSENLIDLSDPEDLMEVSISEPTFVSSSTSSSKYYPTPAPRSRKLSPPIPAPRTFPQGIPPTGVSSTVSCSSSEIISSPTAAASCTTPLPAASCQNIQATVPTPRAAPAPSSCSKSQLSTSPPLTTISEKPVQGSRGHEVDDITNCHDDVTQRRAGLAADQDLNFDPLPALSKIEDVGAAEDVAAPVETEDSPEDHTEAEADINKAAAAMIVIALTELFARRINHDPGGGLPSQEGRAIKIVQMSRSLSYFPDMFYPDDVFSNYASSHLYVASLKAHCHDVCLVSMLLAIGINQVRHLFHAVLPSLSWPDFIASFADCRSSKVHLDAGGRSEMNFLIKNYLVITYKENYQRFH